MFKPTAETLPQVAIDAANGFNSTVDGLVIQKLTGIPDLAATGASLTGAAVAALAKPSQGQFLS